MVRFNAFLMLLLLTFGVASGNTLTCPSIGQVVQNKEHYWGVVGGSFRSFDVSFASTLSTFLGAQWQGTNLGQVTCVYKPATPDFLVTLLYDNLVYVPTKGQGRWVSSHQGSVYDCRSNNPADCAFSVRVKPPVGNIYQEATQLRQGATSNDTPGF